MIGINVIVMLSIVFIGSGTSQQRPPPPSSSPPPPPTSSPAYCSWPTNIQKYKFYNDRGMVTLASLNPYTIEIEGVPGSKLKCIARSGPFILRQGEDGKYKCLYFIDVCKDAFVNIETDAFESYGVPNLCEVCTDETLTNKPEVWVAKSKTSLQCNLPKNCKCEGTTAIPCTGCEPNVHDDGNCLHCRRESYRDYYGDYEYAPKRRYYGYTQKQRYYPRRRQESEGYEGGYRKDLRPSRKRV